MKVTVLAIVLLSCLYAAVLADFGLANLLVAAIVAATLLYLWRDFLFGGRPGRLSGLLRRAVAFFPFLCVVVADVVQGALQVALVVLHLRRPDNAGVVAVPVGERTERGVAVTSLVSVLSPGTVFIESDDAAMLFHVLDASDPDGVRAGFERFYQRYQRSVFP